MVLNISDYGISSFFQISSCFNIIFGGGIIEAWCIYSFISVIVNFGVNACVVEIMVGMSFVHSAVVISISFTVVSLIVHDIRWNSSVIAGVFFLFFGRIWYFLSIMVDFIAIHRVDISNSWCFVSLNNCICISIGYCCSYLFRTSVSICSSIFEGYIVNCSYWSCSFIIRLSVILRAAKNAIRESLAAKIERNKRIDAGELT